uniref:(northern house mosquito) hypothetical protein n=1 Tax=Culex pipiens TaxID=7175 RepID=A0A8D8BGH2_CULPI
MYSSRLSMSSSCIKLLICPSSSSTSKLSCWSSWSRMQDSIPDAEALATDPLEVSSTDRIVTGYWSRYSQRELESTEDGSSYTTYATLFVFRMKFTCPNADMWS